MGEYDSTGRLRWQWLLEWVIIPCSGLLLAAYGALGGPNFRLEFIPVIVGMIAYPAAKVVDRARHQDR